MSPRRHSSRWHGITRPGEHDQLWPLERQLVEMLLAGEMEPFPTLRAQLARVRVTVREDYCGQYVTRLAVPLELPRTILARHSFCDVVICAEGEESPMAATLYAECGALSSLEYSRSYDREEKHPRVIRLSYSDLLVFCNDAGEENSYLTVLRPDRNWDDLIIEYGEAEEIHRRRVAAGELRWRGEP